MWIGIKNILVIKTIKTGDKEMYLDPGFGSMVIQLIIAAIAAAGSFLFICRQKVVNFFKKKTTHEEIENDKKED